MKPREKGEGEWKVKSWDGRMASEALLSGPNFQLQGQVAGGGSRPCFCCLQVPAPGSTSMVVPRILDIGERSLQGLLAMCLSPIPTHNLQPNTGEAEWGGKLRWANRLVFSSFPNSWWQSLTPQSAPPSGSAPFCLLRSALSLP